LDLLLRPEFADAVGPIEPLRYIARERRWLGERSPLSRTLHLNFTTYLPGGLLVKNHRMTMAKALEGRAPFFDRELVEYVASLPDRCKINGRRTKAVLRDAFRDMVPPEIQRRPKMGFGVPLAAWFRGGLRKMLEDALRSRSARYREFLSSERVESL